MIDEPAAGRATTQANRELLRHYRQRRGWTQRELAQICGFSVRLIAKAEAGGALSPHTLEILATALSSKDEQLSSQDLVSSPKSLAMRYVALYRKHEANLVAEGRDLFAVDMIAVIAGGESGTPLAGVYGSAKEYDGFCRSFFSVFFRPDKDLFRPKYVADGRNVLVVGRELIQLFNGPQEPPGWLVLDMLFANGKLIRIEHLFDTGGFNAAITRWRKARSDS